MPKHKRNKIRGLPFYSTKKAYFAGAFFAELHFLVFWGGGEGGEGGEGAASLARFLRGGRRGRRGGRRVPKKKACFGTVLASPCLVMGIGVHRGYPKRTHMPLNASKALSM